MATPIIRSAQTGKPTVDGVDRKDLITGSAVTVTDIEPSNTGGTRYWRMLFKPPTSAAAMSSSTADSPTFTPDVPGTYTIECEYIKGGSVHRFYQYLAVVHPVTGIRVPAAGEGVDPDGEGRLFDDGGGDDFGYWSAYDDLASEVETLASAGGGGGGPAEEILESSGPTTLAVGAIADGQLTRRNGSTLVGIARAGADTTAVHSGDSAGGSIGGTFPTSLTVTKLNETGGPTALTIGAIADTAIARRNGTSFEGILPASLTVGIANALKSSSGSVDFAAAPAPSANQVPIASSGSAAAWGDILSIFPKYWLGTLSGDVAAVTDNTLVDFDTKSYERGTFTLDGSGGITPEAGTYLGICWIDALSTNAAGNFQYQFYYDLAGTPAAKGLPGDGTPVTNTAAIVSKVPAIAIFAVDGSKKLGVRVTAVNSTHTITTFASYSKLLLIQVGAGS